MSRVQLARHSHSYACAGHPRGYFAEHIDHISYISPGKRTDLLDDRSDDQRREKSLRHSAQSVNKYPVQ